MKANYLKLLVLYTVLFLTLFTPSKVISEQERAYKINSYINYKPNKSMFQTELHGVIKLINDAFEAQDFNKSIIKINSLLKSLSRGHHDDLYLLLGYSYEQLGNYDDALLAYAKSANKSVRKTIARFRHGYILQKQNKFESAISNYKEVLWHTDTLEEEVLFVIAECLFALSKNEQAHKHLIMSAEKNPSFLPASRLLVKNRLAKIQTISNTDERLKEEQLLMEELSRLVNLDPSDRNANLLYGKMLIRDANKLYNPVNLRSAEEIAKRLIALSDNKDPEAFRLLFDVQLKKDDLSGAEKTINAGIKHNKNSQVLKQALAQLELQKQVVASP
jgi:tetratricopeptide (TPR) repeat protein